RATGVALDNLRSALAKSVADGTLNRIGPTTHQTVLSVDVWGDEATLRACFVDESGSYDAASGAVVEPMRIMTSIDTVRFQRVDGAWLVSSRQAPAPGEMWEGVTSCAG